jgi:hypothetical protein
MGLMYDANGREFEVGYEVNQDLVGDHPETDLVGQVFAQSATVAPRGGSGQQAPAGRYTQQPQGMRPTGRQLGPGSQTRRQPIGAEETGIRVEDQTAGACRGTLRRQVLPIPRQLIIPTGIVLVKLEPQRVFRVERLILVSSIGALSNVFITSFNVGADPQFVSSGEVPIRCYAPDAIDTSLKGMTAKPGVQVILTLLNIGGADETVSGMFTGWAID